jgi:HEAT repeats
MLMDERQAGGDVWTLWCLGLLAGRGVEPNRIFDFLVPYLSDPDPDLRYWAIEALAYSGDERMIPYLLGVLHDDPSPNIRERAACSLAQSGMLPAEARFQAVPTLLEFSDDPALDATTRRWVFQALRDITGQSLPPNSGRWRDWWASAAQSRQG